MISRTLIVAAALASALAAPTAASAGEPAPLPKSLTLVSVDTRDCFERVDSRTSIVESFNSTCQGLAEVMPAQRRMPAIRARVDKVLCPRVDGERQCRTSINPRKLNDYQVVFLAYQLGVSTF